MLANCERLWRGSWNPRDQAWYDVQELDAGQHALVTGKAGLSRVLDLVRRRDRASGDIASAFPSRARYDFEHCINSPEPQLARLGELVTLR